jgi:hypothetical protein
MLASPSIIAKGGQEARIKGGCKHFFHADKKSPCQVNDRGQVLNIISYAALAVILPVRIKGIGSR